MASPQTSNADRHLLPEEIERALTVLQQAFRQVRPLILERAGKVTFTDKQDGSPVTDTDVEVEKVILAAMAHDFPDVPIYGEEGGYNDDMTGAFWLVDPIDGTQSFIDNIPAFTSMAVLIQGGEAVASVIYNPSTDEMYTAQKNGGAYKNGVRLDLSVVPLPGVAFCKARFSEALNSMLQPSGVVCDIGVKGGGYGFTMVADGKAAARFNMLGGGYIHDYAPGALLVREAGGVLLPIQEDVYTYKTKSFAACHPDLEPVLRPHLLELRALETKMADKK